MNNIAKERVKDLVVRFCLVLILATAPPIFNYFIYFQQKARESNEEREYMEKFLKKHTVISPLPN
jgi:hypothetical protein